jgi:hypothetical protein
MGTLYSIPTSHAGTRSEERKRMKRLARWGGYGDAEKIIK